MIPGSAKDISIDWLSTALRPLLDNADATITEVSANPHGAPGQTADTVSIDVSYDKDDTALPKRIFGKITAQNTETLALVKSMDLYRREVSFYTNVTDVGLPVPHCYYAEFDPASYECVLLLEDLSDGESPSWGITVAQAEAAIEQLPAFHAKWWNRPEAKQFDWAIQIDEQEYWTSVRKDLPKNLGIAIERIGDDLPATFRETVNLALAKFDAFLNYLETRPFSLVHGDYHFKQIFFPRSNGRGRFAVFDWQFPYVAPGAWDLARVMAMTLPTDVRRKSQDRLLSSYLQQLRANGVENYNERDLIEDMGSGCLINILIHASAFGGTDLAIVEKEAGAFGVRWQDVLIDQIVDASTDFEVPQLLQRL